jgi:uncharacterized protein YecE (DUF72 family)
MNPTWKQNCPGRLAEERVGFCNIDQPRLGKITARIRARDSASRLRALAWTQLRRVVPCHNRNDKYNFLSKLKEIEGGKEKITHISQQAEKSFVVANNHFKGQAAVNALELKNMLSGERVKAPKLLVEHYSEQLIHIAQPV